MSFNEQKTRPEDALSTILCKIISEQSRISQKVAVKSSPWNILDNFRVNYTDERVFNLVEKDHSFQASLKYLSSNTYHVSLKGLDKNMEIVYPEVSAVDLGNNQVQITIKNHSTFKAHVRRFLFSIS